MQGLNANAMQLEYYSNKITGNSIKEINNHMFWEFF